MLHRLYVSFRKRVWRRRFVTAPALALVASDSAYIVDSTGQYVTSAT